MSEGARSIPSGRTSSAEGADYVPRRRTGAFGRLCALCSFGSCDVGELAVEGTWRNNPILVQVLGICSALAVTTRLSNSLVMGGALVFVLGVSNVVLSLLRRGIPRRIRMMVEMAVIATAVITVDQMLRAFYWDMSQRLGAYVGLIITNCIIMGRAEAFALHNRPWDSLVDGVTNGLGYAAVLAVIGCFRELVGSGSLLGLQLLPPELYQGNQVFILAPGAFFALGFLIWILKAWAPAGRRAPALPSAGSASGGLRP